VGRPLRHEKLRNIQITVLQRREGEHKAEWTKTKEKGEERTEPGRGVPATFELPISVAAPEGVHKGNARNSNFALAPALVRCRCKLKSGAAVQVERSIKHTDRQTLRHMYVYMCMHTWSPCLDKLMPAARMRTDPSIRSTNTVKHWKDHGDEVQRRTATRCLRPAWKVRGKFKNVELPGRVQSSILAGGGQT